MKHKILFGLGASLIALAGCSPTVKLEAPDKPIVIDMNVKLKVEREADKAIQNNPDIF